MPCLAMSYVEFYAYLLIILPIIVVLLILGSIVTITGIKMYRTKRRQKQAQCEIQAKRIRPDGRPYPPTARGMCQNCKQVSEMIYYMPSGEKLCRGCYHQTELAEAPYQKDTPAEEPT